MPSYPTQPDGSLRWNCERPTDDAVAATLRAPSGGQADLPLCPDCYTSSYRPLAAAVRDVAPTADRYAATVLVVDDDPDLRWLLRETFRDEGYAVETAAHGLEALHTACRRMPDVVVLDLRMPVMDGHTFIAAWRQVTSAASVPIVAISALERRVTTEGLGVEAFLPKPLDLRALVEAVGSLRTREARPTPA